MKNMDYSLKYPNIRWAPDKNSAFEFKGWADVVCETSPYTAYANRGIPEPLNDAATEAKIYHISPASVATVIMAMMSFKRGAGSKPLSNLLVVGPLNEFNRAMEIATWHSRKHYRAESHSSFNGAESVPGITGTLLASAGSGVWHRYLYLSDEPSESDRDLALTVATVQGTAYARLDLPDCIIPVREHLPDFDMQLLMERVDMVVFVPGGRCGRKPYSEAAERLHNNVNRIPFKWAFLDYVDGDQETATQMVLVAAALLDYESRRFDYGKIAVVGPASHVDRLLLSTIQVWNTHIPAHRSGALN